jgi:PIN domain nuclease of toxin-antitoxin system
MRMLAMVEGQDLTIVPLTMQHAAREIESPVPHRDPFDELLLVQAQEEGLKLLTADRQLIEHPLAITA